MCIEQLDTDRSRKFPILLPKITMTAYFHYEIPEYFCPEIDLLYHMNYTPN